MNTEESKRLVPVSRCSPVCITANRHRQSNVGGLALAIHGEPRLTVNIDIVVAAKDIKRDSEIVAAVGFDDVFSLSRTALITMKMFASPADLPQANSS